MAITAEAPRGGVVEYLGGTSYTFVLRNREIERFEDKHRGIFEFWDGIFGRGKKPTSTEVRDLVALGLVGGGMKDAEADKIVSACGPDDLLRMFQLAQAIIGVAFMPDAMDQASKKKTRRARSPSASTSEG
jgi:hypothetical protein